jgi:hypothetical protein
MTIEKASSIDSELILAFANMSKRIAPIIITIKVLANFNFLHGSSLLHFNSLSLNFFSDNFRD